MDATKSCCLLCHRYSAMLYLAVSVLMLIASSNPVLGQSHTVHVTLLYRSLITSGCIGGDEVGLTNTSVLLQYRLRGGSSVEWTDIAVMDVKPAMGETNVMESVVVDSSSVAGLQFRLLQLEHGGGECNCWTLDSMTATLDNQTDVQTLTRERDICFTTDPYESELGLGTFCGRGAEEARGAITRVFYFPGSNHTIECDERSDTLLFDRGPSLLSNCSMRTPRL